MIGKYVNKGNHDFAEARMSEYVDKSELIGFINRTLSTPAKMTCVSRARRFGKSMALQMLYAYYDCSCDSRSLFEDLLIAKDATFEEHMNKYYAIHLDMTTFVVGVASVDDVVNELQQRVIEDVKSQFPDVEYPHWNTLMDVLFAVATQNGRRFVVFIDEWDALFREFPEKTQVLEQYLRLLRSLFKADNTNRVFAGVYMTGILPIKSYGTQSALNNFRSYSMVDPEPLEQYFGFTESEAKMLCERHEADYEDLTQWYNGYRMGNKGIRIFNPTSVMTMLTTGVCKGYWARTESFESVRNLIDMNFDGVKQALEQLLTEQPTKVTVTTFSNDSSDIHSKDELLTLLIHYGYLGYDALNQEAYIPNLEVRQELLQAIKNGKHTELVKMVTDSEQLLQHTWACDGDYVAQCLDALHTRQTAPLFYNNEQALRSLIHLAYLAAVDEYVKIQELPTGKGAADVVFIPRKGSSKPAMIVELKYENSAESAIAQIKEKNYPQVVSDFAKEILLVGINYNAKTKSHDCQIVLHKD